MSIVSDLEKYLESRPDEEIFELLYVLSQCDQIAKDWVMYNETDIDEELKIVDETIDEVFNDKRWFELKEGRYEAFLNYVHEHLLAYYNTLKEN